MGLVQILIGLGLIVVAYRGHLSGEIRAGSAGLRPYTPSRHTHPLAFQFFLALYLGAGLALLVWGVLALLGRAEPMSI
jgi:hypothetical protein